MRPTNARSQSPSVLALAAAAMQRNIHFTELPGLRQNPHHRRGEQSPNASVNRSVSADQIER
jgi:hypothetical protein